MDGLTVIIGRGAENRSLVSLRHGRKFTGIELNPQYAEMARNRIKDDNPLFNNQQGGR